MRTKKKRITVLLASMAGVVLVVMLSGCGWTIQAGVGKNSFEAASRYEPEYRKSNDTQHVYRPSRRASRPQRPGKASDGAVNGVASTY